MKGTTIAALLRAAIVVHRWLGVALCTLFALWFASAFVMVYHGFPELTERDRIAHAAPIEPARVRFTALEARLALPSDAPATPVALLVMDGRPAYVFGIGHDAHVVYADDGTPRGAPTHEMLREAAVAWAGRGRTITAERSLDLSDQWTLEGELRILRPLWKFTMEDGQQVYVLAATGEVLQATTRAERVWAYFGAIPHFLYFPPLRRHVVAWRRVVAGLAGFATLGAILGIVIGLSKFSPTRKFRRGGSPAFIPYAGWKRWHQIIGLSVGVVAFTWAMSGMLSVEPFGEPAPANDALDTVATALRGDPADVAVFRARAPREALLASGPGVRRLEVLTVAGQPMYVATMAPGVERFVPLTGVVLDGIGATRVSGALRSAAGGAALVLRLVDSYDAYYRDRHGALPLPVLLVTTPAAPGSRLYVDPRTAEIVGRYWRADWAERWLYHGLHSLDLPGLYGRRPLWDVTVLVLLAAGLTLSVTSLVLAWRVLQRKLAPGRASRRVV